MPPFAARILDLTTHGPPLTPGIGSPDVLIEYLPAWRALPKGVGAGLEAASKKMDSFMKSASLTPANATPKLAQISADLMKSVVQAAVKGNPAAIGPSIGGIVAMMTTNIALTATWTAASPLPGGQPAATTAYTLGIKAAAAAAASAAFSAVAGMADMHMCPLPCPVPPHGPGVVTQGAKDVMINKLPACRMDDKVIEACGGSDPILLAATNTIIGDKGGSGGGGGGAKKAAKKSEKAAKKKVEKEKEKYEGEAAAAMLVQAGAIGAALVPCLQEGNTAEGPTDEEETCTTFRLHVADENTGDPMPGVTLLITMPDGTQEPHTTDANGDIVIDDLEEPGACDVTSDIEGATNEDTADFVRMD